MASRQRIGVPMIVLIGITSLHAASRAQTTVAAPTSLAATATAAPQVNLTWRDNAANATNIVVYRATAGDTTVSIVARLGATATAYKDTSVKAGATYQYAVRALDKSSTGSVYSSYSNVATAIIPSVQLPIEVLGAAGAMKTATVTVPSTTAPSVVALWMQVHALSYANKASVQVNNSAWFNLNNSSVFVASPGRSYGGIGGVFATLKLTLPLPAGTVVAGANTVRFRFNGTDGVSMGFRVLAFNFVSSTGAMVLPAATFGQDDPNGWQPPYSDSANIAAGGQLWRSAALINSPINRTAIQAKCTDCHAQDGRDLKYFNYSNLSIVERSKFHGLTATQGQQIASYIRTRPTVNPGRPWNPPYQPGPGTDAKPLSSWAAGAGLDAVLDRDIDALPYLFPNGITKAAVATSGTLKMREIPIALQLPDWNHWLPTVHPKDAFGASWYNSVMNKRYNGEGSATLPVFNRVMRAALLSSSSTYYITSSGSDGLRSSLTSWVIDDRKSFLGPTVWANTTVWTPQLAEQVYSLGQWELTKTWELMQEFGLETYGPTLYSPTTESRSWFSQEPFMASPFMLGIRNSSSGSLSLGTARSEYLSNAWYHIQTILFSGNGRHNSNFPVDWGYYSGFLENLDRTTAVPNPMRLIATQVKAMQEGDNGVGPNYNWGWNPRLMFDASNLVNGQYDVCWTDTPAATRTALLQAVLGSWFDTAKKFTPQQYYTAGLAQPTYMPVQNWDGSWADRLWCMIPKYRAAAVDGVLLNSICDWAPTVWPNANWASLKK